MAYTRRLLCLLSYRFARAVERLRGVGACWRPFPPTRLIRFSRIAVCTNPYVDRFQMVIPARVARSREPDQRSWKETNLGEVHAAQDEPSLNLIDAYPM